MKESKPPRALNKSEWQLRAINAGLSQAELAHILDRDQTYIYRALRGKGRKPGEVPLDIRAAILAYEIMAPEQRTEWLQRVKLERERQAE